MDLYDDIFNDQLLQFSPLRFSPSPEPLTPLLDFMPDPLVEGTENVDDEAVGLINNPATSEANPLMGPQSPNLVPFPETLTLLQNPPEMEDQQQLLCNSQGYLQEDVPNKQSDQQLLFNQNMLDSFQESDAFAMPYQPLVCNSHRYLQGNLTNGQLDQQSLFSQNVMSPFQEPNDSTMIEHGQQIEGENSGYAHPIMTQSFEVPNHPQEQFLPLPLSQNYPSDPTYQHGLVASHFNMYDQQAPPLVLPNREDEALVQRVVTNLARINFLPNQIPETPLLSQMQTSTLPNQISGTPPLPQMSSSSTKTNSLPNQISVTSPMPQMPSSSTRTNPLPNQVSVTRPMPQMPSSSIRIQENVQEQGNQPSPGVVYPTLDTYARAQGLPCTKAFAPIDFNVLGRRQRNYQSRFEHGESSSATQRRRINVPKRNVDLSAANNGQERLQNTLYSPLYETLGLKIDPHLRNFAILPLPPKKLG